jgi:molybdopterin synthase catalytic subunit
MAEKKMLDLCQNLRSKWPLHNIAIWHRLGEVRPREASIVIAVTSEHRKASLEAVQVKSGFQFNDLFDLGLKSKHPKLMRMF